MAQAIGFHNAIWSDVPCTVNEVARVMTYTCDEDCTKPIFPISLKKSSGLNHPCPKNWELVPSNEIDQSRTRELRFRVMVHREKRVAMVAFRCTDMCKVADLDLDKEIIARAWTIEQASRVIADLPKFFSDGMRSGLAQLLNNLGKNFVEGTLDRIRWIVKGPGDLTGYFVDKQCSDNPFDSVEEANTFIQNIVKPWAGQRKYTLIVGGYSLGGFLARYVGVKQNLHNVSFDGLWGASKFLHTPIPQSTLDKCATIVKVVNSSINWSNQEIGFVYQTSPSPNIDKGSMGHMGHSMSYFYDYHEYKKYESVECELSSWVVAYMYNLALTSDRTHDLKVMHEAYHFFKYGGFYHSNFAHLRSEDLKHRVYYEMWCIMGHKQDVSKQYGEECFYGINNCRATSKQRAQAIENALAYFWLRAWQNRGT